LTANQLITDFGADFDAQNMQLADFYDHPSHMAAFLSMELYPYIALPQNESELTQLNEVFRKLIDLNMEITILHPFEWRQISLSYEALKIHYPYYYLWHHCW
jgi:hypothetical protein